MVHTAVQSTIRYLCVAHRFPCRVWKETLRPWRLVLSRSWWAVCRGLPWGSRLPPAWPWRRWWGEGRGIGNTSGHQGSRLTACTQPSAQGKRSQHQASSRKQNTSNEDRLFYVYHKRVSWRFHVLRFRLYCYVCIAQKNKLGNYLNRVHEVVEDDFWHIDDGL